MDGEKDEQIEVVHSGIDGEKDEQLQLAHREKDGQITVLHRQIMMQSDGGGSISFFIYRYLPVTQIHWHAPCGWNQSIQYRTRSAFKKR